MMKSSTIAPNTQRRGKQGEPEFKEATLIQVIKTPRGTMNHSYRDFSKVPPEDDYEHPKEMKNMTFSQKVHHILSNPDHEKWISWMPHGRAFKVHVPVMFETQICPKYFGHKRYSSFLRELNNYGFKHISKGTDRNCYYHELMLKDRPHLCKYMPRCKDARRLVADPQNEPNFYRISRQYPLDGDAAAKGVSELPPAKRSRNDTTALPQGLTLGGALLGALSNSSGTSLLGAAPTPLDYTTPSGPINEAAVLLKILEAQNKQREEQKQLALLASALLQQSAPAPVPQPAPASSNDALVAVLGLLCQQ